MPGGFPKGGLVVGIGGGPPAYPFTTGSLPDLALGVGDADAVVEVRDAFAAPPGTAIAVSPAPPAGVTWTGRRLTVSAAAAIAATVLTFTMTIGAVVASLTQAVQVVLLDIWAGVLALVLNLTTGASAGAKADPATMTLPSGVTRGSQILTVTGAGVTLSGIDLRNWSVVWNGAGGRFTDNLSGLLPGNMGGPTYPVRIGIAANGLVIDHNTFAGGDTYSANMACFVTQDVAAGVYATGISIRDNRFDKTPQDALKVKLDGSEIVRNVFSGCVNCPPGTLPYNPATSYATGDYATQGGNLWQALSSTTGTAPPAGTVGNATWGYVGTPHSDCISVTAVGAGGGVIRGNVLDWPQDARALGLTNLIRGTRDSNGQLPYGRLLVEGNVLRPFGGVYPISWGPQNDWASGTAYQAGQVVVFPGGPSQLANARLWTCAADTVAGESPTTAPAKWTLSRETKFAGPLELRHNMMGGGLAGALFYPDPYGLHVIADDNRDLARGAIAMPDGQVLQASATPAFADAPTSAVTLTPYGPGSVFDVTPSAYGSLRYGGATISALALRVGDQLVGHITSAGAAVAYANRDVTITAQGGGVWRLALLGSGGTGTTTGTLRVVAGAAAVVVDPVDVPVNTALPVITGTPIEGQVLTASTGTWAGSPTGYAFQWRRGGIAIAGATASTYTLAPEDVGVTPTVTVTASNASGSASATSAGVGPVVGNWALVSRAGSTTLDATDTDHIAFSLDSGATWLPLTASGVTVTRDTDGQGLLIDYAGFSGTTPIWDLGNKRAGEPNNAQDAYNVGLWARHAGDPAPLLAGIAALPVLASRAATPVSTT